MAPGAALALCDRCGAAVVVPVLWHENGSASWWIRRRCGACGAVRETIAGNAEAAAYDAYLRRGMEQIRREVTPLTGSVG
jgi:ribosomal protein S27AE